MTGDILCHGGYLFSNTGNHINIYNNSDHSFAYSINLEGGVPVGKFNPMFLNERLHSGDANTMTVDPVNNRIFVVTPELNIKCYSASPGFNLLFTITKPSSLPLYFAPLHGLNIIKYDWIHDRIFWVVTARDQQYNCTGQYHYRERYFAIFENINSGNPNLFFYELKDKTEYEDCNISDVEFNQNIYVNVEDYFYLTKLNKIEVYKFNGSNIELVDSIIIDPSKYFNGELDDGPYYKFGKMIYVKEAGIHKIIALPYRYPSSLPTGKPSDFWVIDGEHGDDISYQVISSPSHRILDGLYLSDNSDLMLSYAPDNSEVIPGIGGENGEDIAIYQFNNSLNSFSNEPTEIVNTDFSVKISEYDINAPLKLMDYNGQVTVISKKDEIVKLEKSQSNYIPTLLLSGEGNFFSRADEDAGKVFVLNTTANETEIFGTGLIHIDSITHGYPVYNITSNHDGSVLYFYHTFNSWNTGFYVYVYDYATNSETVFNINQDGIGSNDFSAPIGDIVYNPFKNQFLVSENGEFSGRPACIHIYDASNHSCLGTIALNDASENAMYAKEMFISPEQKLYVMANMHLAETLDPDPKIFVFNANDGQENIYTLERTASFVECSFNNPDQSFEYYSGHFCYNHYDGKVYATIHPTEVTFNPYHSVTNTMFGYSCPGTGPIQTGLFIKTDEDPMVSVSLDYPGKIICPDIGTFGNTSQFENKMFIAGKNLYVYDGASDSFLNGSSGFEYSINDIVYVPGLDSIFAISDMENSCGTDRNISLFGIGFNETQNTISIEEGIYEFPGQGSGLFYNSYNSSLYIYQKYDQHKKGGIQNRLIEIPVHDPNATPTNIDLGFRSIYPDLDHDSDFHYYFYNLIEPYFNPYNHSMYFPNGGHSKVSRVEFTPDEQLPLQDGRWSWLSFPRLNRDGNDPVSVPEILGGSNIVPDNYNDGSKLQNLPIGGASVVANEYNNPNWQQYGLLPSAKSTLGYKLYLNYDDPQPYNKRLHLNGSVIDPLMRNVDLMANVDNWLGYYLYQEQFPFNAISDEDLEDIYMIQSQYWSCAKFWGDGIPTPYWLCCCSFGKGVSLKYGDMVILKTDEPIQNFHWLIFGIDPGLSDERLSTEYYSFQEQSSYIPIFVEMDTSDNPVEIGAFVQDSCIGATTVLDSDTMVMISAYTEGLSGEIYFEEYYGSNKSFSPPRTEYFVKTPKALSRERRMIHTSENEDYYFVSLKNHTGTTSLIPEDPWIVCTPNPIRDYATIKYQIPRKGFFEISLYGILQNQKWSIKKGYSREGVFSFQPNIQNFESKNLSEGVYILVLQVNDSRVHTKVVYIK